MLYYRTNKIPLVKKLLGHKNINSARTMRHTQLVNFKDSNYDVANDEFNGIYFYRKPKRLATLA